MNKFEKVSYEQFKEDYFNCFGDEGWDVTDERWLRETYENIKLPSRAHKGDAGADFFSPITMKLEPETTIKFPTGIKCFLDEDKFLAIVPRSSLGFKYRLWLDNLIGIIDSSYAYADNEGHIMCKITNNSLDKKEVIINEGSAFAQGIILPYFVAENDQTMNIERSNGIGSSDKERKDTTRR